MAQQVFPQWSPVVKAHNEDQQEVYIPAAIIHAQTRDGKDELIVGAANMQKDDATGLYLPTDKDFPLEVRVRHLEALIGKLDASKETDPDAASATLLALLRGLLATIAAIKGNDGIKKIADAVTVDGLNALATESTLGEVKSALAALGATSDAAETDPAETASQIALLKGLLTGLNTVAGTVDNGAAKVTLTGHTVDMATETTLAQAVDKLNSILSRLEGKLDTAIFDSQGNPISAANRLPVDATVSGTVDVSDRADRQLGQVALTGSSVPMRYLVIDYGDVELAGRYNIFGSSFSTTTSGSSRDSRRMLDVSLYRKVMIRIENKSDNAVSVGSIYFGSEPDSVFGDSVKSISLGNIPALATVWLTPWEGDDVVYMPELASGFPSLGIYGWPGSGLYGTVNVKVWGWN